MSLCRILTISSCTRMSRGADEVETDDDIDLKKTVVRDPTNWEGSTNDIQYGRVGAYKSYLGAYKSYLDDDSFSCGRSHEGKCFKNANEEESRMIWTPEIEKTTMADERQCHLT